MIPRSASLNAFAGPDDARRDLERTIADIASAGYHDVELLGSMNTRSSASLGIRTVVSSPAR